MHRNHRRQNPLEFFHHGSRWGFRLRWHKQHEWRTRRQAVRQLLYHERYDQIPDRYRSDLLYYLL